MFKKRYRIVTDTFCGYECQAWRWWLPFWIQMGPISNTHTSIEDAKKYIENYNPVVVLKLD